MKICPSCNARLGDEVSICSSCEYRFDAEAGDVRQGVQKTMMGLPALTDYQSMAKNVAEERGKSQEPGKSPVGSTLFGLPALNFADAFSEPSEVSDASTSMISAGDLKKALHPELHLAKQKLEVAAREEGEGAPGAGSRMTSRGMTAPALGDKPQNPESTLSAGAAGKPAPDAAKMTAFGMRAPTMAELEKAMSDVALASGGDASRPGEDPWIVEDAPQRLSGERLAEATDAFRDWGLGEEVSSEDAHTQVVSAEVLQRSGFGGDGTGAQAIGFGAEDYSNAKQTIMGMAIDSEVFLDPDASSAAKGGPGDDATRAVKPGELFGAGLGAENIDGLENILDKVRSDTLARQTTSLNVPSVSSTPASGLVRVRPEVAQASRASMNTPVMHADPELVAETDAGAHENQAGTWREAPTSGVFKKLKRRLAEEAAATEESGLTGSGVYQIRATDSEVVREDPFGEVEHEVAGALSLDQVVSSFEPDFGASPLSEMADDLASIPIPEMSDAFAGPLDIPEDFALEAESFEAQTGVASAAAESVQAPASEVESAGIGEVAESALAGAGILAGAVQPSEDSGLREAGGAAMREDVAAVDVVQSSFEVAKPAVVQAENVPAEKVQKVEGSTALQENAGKAEAGLNKKVLLAILLVVIVVAGLILMFLG